MRATRRRLLGLGAGLLGGVAGCLGGPEADTESGLPNGDMTLSSDEITAGSSIPRRFTCDGADVSPPLSFSGVPDDAETLAIVLEDPDAPSGTFTHWLLWDIPPDRTSIPERIPRDPVVNELGEARQGRNDFDEVGYRGPCPPAGQRHTYRFTVHALDGSLPVEPGARPDPVNAAIENHQLAFGHLTAPYG